jgi:hypothetical protein
VCAKCASSVVVCPAVTPKSPAASSARGIWSTSPWVGSRPAAYSWPADARSEVGDAVHGEGRRGNTESTDAKYQHLSFGPWRMVSCH